MTSPNPITVSVATDQASYNQGDTITATVTYTDSATTSQTLTVTATVSDNAGNSAQGTAQVQVNSGTGLAETVAVADDWGNTYTQTTNDPGSSAFTAPITGTAPAPTPV